MSEDELVELLARLLSKELIEVAEFEGLLDLITEDENKFFEITSRVMTALARIAADIAKISAESL